MTTIKPTTAFNKGIKEYLKLDVYDEIMRTYATIDLSDGKASAEFRKMFNGYYRIRRDKDWQDKYYSLFEEVKGMAEKSEPIYFDDILYILFKSIGQVEKSFASKMLATINPNKPILDSRIIRYLNSHGEHIGYSGYVIESAYLHYGKDVTESDKKRLGPAIREYEDLELWYEEYIDIAEADKVANAFDTAFPEFKDSKHFTRTRKIDWYLWLLG